MNEHDDYYEVDDPEPEIPQDEECEICDKPATIAFDASFYCEDCYTTDIAHQ